MEHVDLDGEESVNLRREPKAFKIYFEFCSNWLINIDRSETSNNKKDLLG